MDSKSNLDIPDAFLCPISQQIMKDPYVDSDGNSFDKEYIYQWLATSSISPITRNPLTRQSLVPNRGLKSMIEAFAKQNGLDLATSNESKVDDAIQGITEMERKVRDETLSALGRKPLVLFTLIDTSGSMGIDCGSGGEGEKDGYSRLDLVKHTLKTIIHSLTSEDEISIITFNTVADILVPRTKLTEANKQDLDARVDLLLPGGQTNIWDGMRKAIEVISNITEKDINVEIYLLTDGEPNINPPGDLVTTVADSMRKNCHSKEIYPVINTFGYGYSLDSTMLYNMARVGDGIFGFIPDATMVGTVFINSLGNSLVGVDFPGKDNTAVQNILLRFTADLVYLLGEASPEQKQEKLGNFVQYLRDFVIDASDIPEEAAIQQWIRDFLDDCCESDNTAIGQIFKALSPAFYSKWGKHYLYSVNSAFEKRVCINFKDKAMQNFKSLRFITEQKRVEDVFTDLPPPRPSNNVNSWGRYGGGGGAGPSGPASMASYLNASGGCFSGDSVVYKRSHDGSWVSVMMRQLQPGDIVRCCEMESGSWQEQPRLTQSEVVCVVKLPYQGDLYAVNDSLRLTPYHPVVTLTQGTAAEPLFPCEAGVQTASADGFVYDIVLRNRGLVQCASNNAQEELLLAATFGHGCTVGKFQHDYFGSEAVVNDLREHAGWERGFVELGEYIYLRNDDGTVKRMLFTPTLA